MFDKQILKEIYERCGVANGGIVYVTGNLGRLGFTSSKQVGKFQTMEDHLDVLLTILGPNGTIVFPTHTWSNFKNGFSEFDPQHTPCDYLFSEFARKNLDPKRTKHCLASIAAYGKDAEEIIFAAQNQNPYGFLSPFDTLVSKNALHVSIGMPVSSTISAVHHCELMAQVPYRFIKEFNYRLVENNICSNAVCTLYVTYLNSDLVRNKNRKIFLLSGNCDELRSFKVGRGIIQSIQLKQFAQTTIQSMLENPYIWLENEPKIRPYNGILHSNATIES